MRHQKRAKKDVKKDNPHRKSQINCQRCGYSHQPRACPAYGKFCNNCKKPNHFASVCRVRGSRVLNSLEADKQDHEEDDLWIGTIESGEPQNRWKAQVTIGDQKIKMKVDSGAEANVIPKSMWVMIKNQPILKMSKTKLKAFGGGIVKHIGIANLEFVVGDRKVTHPTYVTEEETCPVLSLKTSLALGLLAPGQNKEFVEVSCMEESPTTNLSNNTKVQKTMIANSKIKELVEQYSCTFGEMGCFKNGEHHIQVDPKVEPVVSPPRRVPLGQRTKLKQKLKLMEEQKVIIKEDEPTDWVNPMILVTKPNGDIRVCMDPQRLNTAIKREHFQLPTLEELMLEMKNAKYFTKLDLSSGFWQIPLDEQSSKLCTFATPFGRYRFKRLPFGIKSAPEVFQKIMRRHFGDIEGVENFVDDLCIWSETLEDHIERLQKVFERAKQCGMKFNKNKCIFFTQTLSYMGHVLTKEGLRMDEDKVKAIKICLHPQINQN